MRKTKEKKNLVMVLVVTVAIAVIAVFIYIKLNNTPDENYDEFAQCLSEKNAVMYGTEWCGFCKKQKQLFGSSFQYVNYVDCNKEKQKCEDNAIPGYPTWIINEEQYPGVQSFEKLSSLTGCEL